MTAAAGGIFAALVGGMYGLAEVDPDKFRSRLAGGVSARLLPEPRAAGPNPESRSAPESYPLPDGVSLSDEPRVAVEAVEPGEMFDSLSGLRIGPLLPRAPFLNSPEPSSEDARAVAAVDPDRRTEGEGMRRRSSTRRATSRRVLGARRASTAPRRASRSQTSVGPRLHADPGLHVIATARQMIARRERFNVSCYRYLAEVYSRAGHYHWRSRRTVFRGDRDGPYADLSLMRPGDWLYIVNRPESRPVGTHSVMFVGWEDRARGYARVIEHPGWGSSVSGQERRYDVRRAYRIIRPTHPR